MIISRVKLRNWKNFPEVDIQLGRRVFIVGPNASGKSNFLDVFRFLHDIVRSGGGLKKAINDRGGVPKIRCLSAKRVSQVEIEIELANSNYDPPEWTYSIGFRQQSRGHRDPELIFERIYHQRNHLTITRPDPDDEKDPLLLTQTHLEQLGKNAEFRPIAEFFNRIHYMHLVPQVLRHPESFKGPVLDEDPFGRTFLERVAETPEKTRKRRLKKIEEALGNAVPQLKNLQDSKDSRGVPHLEALYDHWRPNAGKQSEEQFSDGTLRLIGFLWNLMENDDVLLMEEPELSLHVGIIRHLPGLIWRLKAKKRQQILLSTHSADLLSDSSIDAQEVLMFIPGAEGTKVVQASEAVDVKNLLDAGFPISEAVISKTEPERAYQLSVFDE